MRFNVVNPAIDTPEPDSKPTPLQIRLSRIVVTLYSLAILALAVPVLFAASIVCGFCLVGLTLGVVSVMMFRKKRRSPRIP